jgi:hypothetical protein
MSAVKHERKVADMFIMSRKSSPRKAPLGVLFWIGTILFVSLVFMFTLPTIRDVIENTSFIEVVFETRNETAPETPAPSAPDMPLSESPTPRDTPAPTPSAPAVPLSEASGSPEAQEEPEITGDRTTETQDEKDEDVVVIAAPLEQEETNSGQRQTTRATIYLIRVTDDGRIVAEPVQRTMTFTTSPLTRSIETLINGPDTDDHNRGLLSLVPKDARLLSARVEGGIAYLNFSEDFRFNAMGLEGYLAQLQQVVLTATAFASVDSVQILVEGNVVEYLGGDGVYIGRPLRPADFTS